MTLHRDIIKDNKGSGLGVILYGVTLLLILIFVAVNIVNAKVIENGYNSLRDAVQSASAGSVIHLLTKESSTSTQAQKNIISGDKYDIYLQLALGYIINRHTNAINNTYAQSGELNNFIKLDHQKVVNETMALLEDAVIRRKGTSTINDTYKYKIMMFFIEPYYNDDNKEYNPDEENKRGQKYFHIVAYGNGDYDLNNGIQREIAETVVPVEDGENDMKSVYKNIETSINSIVNCGYGGMDTAVQDVYGMSTSFEINLNADGSNDYDKLIREMETYPHYLIVVKDFALPTIFDGVETNSGNPGIKSLFTSLSGDGSLSSPMCALNTGKIQRQTEDKGWSHNR